MKTFVFLALVMVTGVGHAGESYHGDVIIRYRQGWQQAGPVAPADLKQCRAKIKDLLCLVGSDDDSQKEPECLSGGDKYITNFEGHFDRSPQYIQKMYCHLDKIWIESNFYATAYASPVLDAQGNVIGGGVGIRREVLDSPMTFDSWLSWKEETSFGGPLKTSDPGLNLIHYRSNRNTKEFFFDYVMNHEFGHLFDFANRINKIECQRETLPDGTVRRNCKLLPSGWSNLTWLNLFKPQSGHDYVFRDKLCFYSCGQHPIAPENADDLFAGLLVTGFHSTYASSGVMEDWAEAFALTIGHDVLGLNYGLEIGGRYFDMSQHFYSPVMADKRAYVQKFIAGPKWYPGEK